MRRLIIFAAVAVAAIAGTATTAFAGNGTDGVFAGRATYGSRCATFTKDCSVSSHGAYFTASPDRLTDGNYVGTLDVRWSQSFVDTGANPGLTCAPVTGTVQFKVNSKSVLRTALIPTANQGADGNSELCIQPGSPTPAFFYYNFTLQVIGGTGSFSHVVKAGSTVSVVGLSSPANSLTSYLDQGGVGSSLIIH